MCFAGDVSALVATLLYIRLRMAYHYETNSIERAYSVVQVTAPMIWRQIQAIWKASVSREANLVDTGPLVALIRKSDRDHDRCSQFAANVLSPLLTTWTVITEAAWLLRNDDRDVDALLQMVGDGMVSIDPLEPQAAEWIRQFNRKYADQSPQLADASLMYLADTLNLETIFTLDYRDFSVYRLENGRTLHIRPE